MSYLLDTNVISELRKAQSGKANAGVVRWTNRVPTAMMHLSVISIHEIEHGVLLAERSDRSKGAVLRMWLENDVKPSFHDRLVAVDHWIATAAAAFHIPDPVPLADALIGATAMVHGLTVVTRDEADFGRFAGVEVLNPWT